MITIQATVLHNTSSDSVLINVVAETNTQSSFSWYCIIDNIVEYQLDASLQDGGYKASKQIIVSEGTHRIRVSNTYEYAEITFTTAKPVVNFTVTDIQLHSITVEATSDISSDLWRFSKDGGDTYINLESPSRYSSRTYTFRDLDINTEYLIKIGVKNPDNEAYGYTGSIPVKTQGGILHVKIGNTWKDALAYVKVNNAWKQAIVYTKVGNNWRIGT